MIPFRTCLVLAAWLALSDGASARLIRQFGQVQPSYGLAYSPDGKLLASSGSDGILRLWDPATGKEVRQLQGGQVNSWSIAFSPDSKLVAAPCADSSIHVWEVATGKEVHQLKGHQATVWCIAASPAGNTLASGSEGGTIRLWDLATGKALRVIAGQQGGIWPLAFAPDGKTLAAGSNAGAIHLWDVATGGHLRQCGGHSAGAWPLVFSPDGRTLASCRWQGDTIRLWDVATGRQRRKIHVFGTGSGWCLAFAPDGKTLLGGGADNTVYLWETVTGRERRQLHGHKGPVHAVAFAPDGRTAASTGADGMIIVWDVTEPPPKAQLTARDLAALWLDLRGTDAARAYQAVWTLAAAPDLAVPFLREQLRPRPVVLPDPKLVARLIADLNDRRFAVRHKATVELEKLGKGAEPALHKALENPPNLEVRMRLQQLLGKLEGLDPNQLQQYRALEVLEHLGTPAAKGVLESLARQEKNVWLSQEAKASLERLGRRAKGP